MLAEAKKIQWVALLRHIIRCDGGAERGPHQEMRVALPSVARSLFPVDASRCPLGICYSVIADSVAVKLVGKVIPRLGRKILLVAL